MGRLDPGLCPICGAAHTACTSGGGPITIPQLPARDALAGEVHSTEPPAELVQPVVEPVPEPFSTAEYTRAKHGLKRPPR